MLLVVLSIIVISRVQILIRTKTVLGATQSKLLLARHPLVRLRLKRPMGTTKPLKEVLNFLILLILEFNFFQALLKKAIILKVIFKLNYFYFYHLFFNFYIFFQILCLLLNCFTSLIIKFFIKINYGYI